MARIILSEENLLEIGRTYGRTETPTSLAKKFGVSKQRIQQLASTFRKRGVDIPKIRTRKFDHIIEQLKREI